MSRSGEKVADPRLSPVLVDRLTACHMLGGITLQYLSELVAKGRLDAKKLGRRTMFEVAELQRFAADLPSWEPPG